MSIPLGSFIKIRTPWPVLDAVGHYGGARPAVKPGTWVFHRSHRWGCCGAKARIPETCGSIWPVKEKTTFFFFFLIEYHLVPCGNEGPSGGPDPFFVMCLAHTWQVRASRVCVFNWGRERPRAIKNMEVAFQGDDTRRHNVSQWKEGRLCKQDRTPHASSATHRQCGSGNITQCLWASASSTLKWREECGFPKLYERTKLMHVNIYNIHRIMKYV